MPGYNAPTTAAYTSLASGGGNMTPAMPTFSAGQLLLLETGVNSTTITPPDLSAQGWVKLTTNTTILGAALYGRFAVLGDTGPTFQWDASHQAYARISAFGGSVYTDLTTIVAVYNERGASTNGAIAVNATAAPSVANCLVIRLGRCVKTATNNGSSFADWSTDSGVYTKVGATQLVQPGAAALAAGLWYWQQTTATLTDADVASLTNVDSAGNSHGFTVVLKSSSGATLAGAAAAATSATAALSTAIQAAGAALTSVSAVAALTNWATVTLSGTQYTGTGGIHDPNFWLDVDPPVGSVLYYDATHITIYANGEISADTNNCSAVVQFFDGTAWSVGLVIITPQMVTYAHILAAAAGALSTSIVMAGAAIAASQAAGGLSTGVHLAGIALAIANAAATLTTGVQMNAAALMTATATGALTGGVASLQGSVTAMTQALGALTTKIQAAGQVIIDSQATGSLTASVVFQGAANALTQASGALSTAIQFAGNANVVVTAAGAALISSAFAGAANIVSTAMGSLLTGLLIAGNALVQVSAAGDLSTGVTLSGSAIVGTAAALKPVGLEGQFGKADINVLSRTGLPETEPTFIQNSACIVSISYFNAQGLPFVPSAVSYRVDDVDSGLNLVPLTPIPLPSMANAITITGTQNSMINLTRSFEEHKVLFQIIDGVGNLNYESAVYDLIRVAGAN
jgi:hypothetical protein